MAFNSFIEILIVSSFSEPLLLLYIIFMIVTIDVSFFYREVQSSCA